MAKVSFFYIFIFTVLCYSASYAVTVGVGVNLSSQLSSQCTHLNKERRFSLLKRKVEEW